MRYNEFIIEDFATEQTLLNNAKTIKQNCQPYLKQNPSAILKYPLYRGVKGGRSVTGITNANVIRKKVRLKDRRPSDMSYSLHKLINDYFKKEYGSPFRSAMFSAGNTGEAAAYGTVYIIFPIGQFEYLWSPKYEDLYSITAEYGFDQTSPFDQHKPAVFSKDVKETLIDEVLSTYQTDNLIVGINSGHEIMIRCKAYYGIHADVMYNKEYRDKINEILYK